MGYDGRALNKAGPVFAKVDPINLHDATKTRRDTAHSETTEVLPTEHEAHAWMAGKEACVELFTVAEQMAKSFFPGWAVIM